MYFCFSLAQVVVQHEGLVGLVYVKFEIHGLQQRALSGTYATDNVDELSLVDVEVYLLQNEDAVLLIDIRFLIVY